jgi:hypothetical protein
MNNNTLIKLVMGVPIWAAVAYAVTAGLMILMGVLK